MIFIRVLWLAVCLFAAFTFSVTFTGILYAHGWHNIVVHLIVWAYIMTGAALIGVKGPESLQG